jgi:hypothetical protein
MEKFLPKKKEKSEKVQCDFLDVFYCKMGRDKRRNLCFLVTVDL